MTAVEEPPPEVCVVRAAMHTDVGRVRERNEDSAYVDADLGLFIVADGMGGHGGGDVASALAVSTVRHVVESARDELLAIARTGDGAVSVHRLLERAVRAAHANVLDRSQRDLEMHNMGTTIDVVLVQRGQAFVAHVGDSRTYLMRDGAARQTTNDHTVAEVMRRAGALTDEEAAVSPLRTVLCNSVGCAPDLAVEHVRLRLRVGDRLLMCTDGLYDYFEDRELVTHVMGASGDSALVALTNEACRRGGQDNITGVIVEVGAPTRSDDDFDELPTSPVDVGGGSGPLGAISDGALGALVDDVLREEESKPHSAG